jgi:hypothetical protein
VRRIPCLVCANIIVPNVTLHSSSTSPGYNTFPSTSDRSRITIWCLYMLLVLVLSDEKSFVMLQPVPAEFAAPDKMGRMPPSEPKRTTTPGLPRSPMDIEARFYALTQYRTMLSH